MIANSATTERGLEPFILRVHETHIFYFLNLAHKKNQVPVNAFESNYVAIRHDILPLELKLDSNGTSTSSVTVHPRRDLCVFVNESPPNSLLPNLGERGLTCFIFYSTIFYRVATAHFLCSLWLASSTALEILHTIRLLTDQFHVFCTEIKLY